MKRQIHSRHCRNFARPKTRCIDQMLGDHRALIGHHLPLPIWGLACLVNLGVQDNLSALHPCRFGIGMGGSRRIKMPIKRIIQPTQNTQNIGGWCNLFNLIRTNDLGVQSHIAVFGAFRL